jgi:hypothetical protein
VRDFHNRIIPILCAIVIAYGGFLAGCGGPDPVRTVQDYLRLLSGERPVTGEALENLTTEHYRNTEHAHLVSLAEEHRGQALDLAAELREDPVIGQFLEKVSWTTTYEVTGRDASSAHVVARVILTERRPGDRQEALNIPGLPTPLRDVIEQGLELPFQFELKMEDGRWKIDDFEFPQKLVSLLEMPSAE